MKKLNIIMNLIKQDLKLNNSDSNIGGVYMEKNLWDFGWSAKRCRTNKF